LKFRILISAVLLILGGCSSAPPVQQSAPVAPTVYIAPETWRMVDSDIWAASYLSKSEALTYAQSAVKYWMDQVRKRTESDFIPWYTSFGAQQWISIKVGWHGMDGPEGRAIAAERLAEYLQRQYYEQVLEPIAPKIDPHKIMERSTRLYVGSLNAGLRIIRDRHDLPDSTFRDRLKSIPAINLQGVSQPRASLNQIFQAGNPGDVPAYAALLAQVQPDLYGMGSSLSSNQFYPVARSSADKLVDHLAVRGGASVAGLAVGGVAGILISIGVTGWQAMEHEKAKPALEADLRSNLDTALNGMQYYLINDPHGGVMAPVNHISWQIENWIVNRHETRALRRKIQL
jgi:hypothetical protein